MSNHPNEQPDLFDDGLLPPSDDDLGFVGQQGGWVETHPYGGDHTIELDSSTDKRVDQGVTTYAGARAIEGDEEDNRKLTNEEVRHQRFRDIKHNPRFGFYATGYEQLQDVHEMSRLPDGVDAERFVEHVSSFQMAHNAKPREAAMALVDRFLSYGMAARRDMTALLALREELAASAMTGRIDYMAHSGRGQLTRYLDMTTYDKSGLDDVEFSPLVPYAENVDPDPRDYTAAKPGKTMQAHITATLKKIDKKDADELITLAGKDRNASLHFWITQLQQIHAYMDNGPSFRAARALERLGVDMNEDYLP